MQYGKDATRRAEQDFRAWTADNAVFGSYYGDAQPTHDYTGRPILWPSKEKNMKQLFWTAVLYRKGKKTTLVVPPETVLAESETKAKVAAIKEIPSDFKERFDRLEVVVRPF